MEVILDDEADVVVIITVFLLECEFYSNEILDELIIEELDDDEVDI